MCSLSCPVISVQLTLEMYVGDYNREKLNKTLIFGFKVV